MSDRGVGVGEANAFPSWEVSEEQLAKVRDKKVRARIAARSRAGEAVGAVDAAGILASLPDRLGLDPGCRAGHGDEELLDMIGSANKFRAWSAAVEYQMIADLVRRQHKVNEHDPGFGVWNDVSAYCSDLIAVACGVSTASAAGRISTALRLTSALTGTLGCLRAGQIDPAKARIMDGLTANLTDEQAGRVERQVIRDLVGPGRSCSYRQWELRIRAAVIDVAPEAAEDRRKRAKESRRVWLNPDEDGMAELGALVSAPDGVAAFAELTRLAKKKAPGDERTLNQRRADALIEALLGPMPVSGSAAALLRETAVDVSFEDADAAVHADAPTPDGGGHQQDDHRATGTDSNCAGHGGDDDRDSDMSRGAGADDSFQADSRSGSDGQDEPECECEPGCWCDDCDRCVPRRLRGTVDLRALLNGAASWDDPGNPISPSGGEPSPGGSGDEAGSSASAGVALSAAGGKPAIQVTVAASTLMGVDERPGELAGYGPITAGMAREIAADGVGVSLQLCKPGVDQDRSVG
jgi:hypothetical protein